MRRLATSTIRGFSLMEILLSLAILGVLAGLSLGSLNGVQVLMKIRESEIRLSALATAFRMYRLDYGKWPEFLGDGSAYALESSTQWQFILGSYLEGHPPGTLYLDGFGRSSIFVSVDADGDGWIEFKDFSGFGDNRSTRVRSRVICYSLNDHGEIAAKTWTAHEEIKD